MINTYHEPLNLFYVITHLHLITSSRKPPRSEDFTLNKQTQNDYGFTL